MARAPAPPLPASVDTQRSLVSYCNETLRLLGKNYNFRTRMTEIDKIYQREMDLTTTQLRAKAANRDARRTGTETPGAPARARGCPDAGSG